MPEAVASMDSVALRGSSIMESIHQLTLLYKQVTSAHSFCALKPLSRPFFSPVFSLVSGLSG